MAKKIIDVGEAIKPVLSKESKRLGFDGLKPYIEALLGAKAKEIALRDAAKGNEAKVTPP